MRAIHARTEKLIPGGPHGGHRGRQVARGHADDRVTRRYSVPMRLHWQKVSCSGTGSCPGSRTHDLHPACGPSLRIRISRPNLWRGTGDGGCRPRAPGPGFAVKRVTRRYAIAADAELAKQQILAPRQVSADAGSVTRVEAIDLDHLFRLRLVVARFGEMDNAKWWNTKGQLGRLGSAALRRGFPRTHHFAQARSVFAVAAHRCSEVFDPPGCVTLWRLPEAIEEEFDVRWEHWLDHAAEFQPLFEKLEAAQGADLVAVLRSHDLAGDRDVDTFSKLRRSAEGRAVPLPGLFSGTDAEATQLALGFARGEVGALAVPYARKSNA